MANGCGHCLTHSSIADFFVEVGDCVKFIQELLKGCFHGVTQP